MATKLIRLSDGTLVEVQVSREDVQKVSGTLAEKVGATVDGIQPVLLRICRPITAAWKELSENVNVEKAEVEIALGFETEGSVYVARTKASGNLKIKLILSSITNQSASGPN